MSYCHLDALDKVDVENYIRHRLTVAGAQNLDLFDPEAIKAIYKHSLGIPRLINTLCDAAFVYGYADDVRVIGRDLIEAVAKARNLGVKGNGLDAALPEDQEKGGGIIPEPQMWLVKELEGTDPRSRAATGIPGGKHLADRQGARGPQRAQGRAGQDHHQAVRDGEEEHGEARQTDGADE